MTCDDVVVYWGTTPKSHQGQIKVISRSNWYKNVICFTFTDLKLMCGAGKYSVHTFFIAYHLDTHLNGFWGIFSPVGVNTLLVFLLSHPFPNA